MSRISKFSQIERRTSENLLLVSDPILYIVATPIGNLEDITLRALNVLRQADFILSEDSRTTAKLLRRYDIHTPLKSYRQHRRQSDLAWAHKKLASGACLALVSNAGTPGISDPGTDLVREVRQKGIATIVPIPGASALSTALSICGWQTNPCIFTGFLSSRRGRRHRFLEELRSFSGAIVIYESVHRLQRLLQDIKEIFLMRDVLVAREMSKLYEEFIVLAAGEIQEWEKQLQTLTLKGEFTVVIAPARGLSK